MLRNDFIVLSLALTDRQTARQVLDKFLTEFEGEAKLTSSAQLRDNLVVFMRVPVLLVLLIVILSELSSSGHHTLCSIVQHWLSTNPPDVQPELPRRVNPAAQYRSMYQYAVVKDSQDGSRSSHIGKKQHPLIKLAGETRTSRKISCLKVTS